MALDDRLLATAGSSSPSDSLAACQTPERGGAGHGFLPRLAWPGNLKQKQNLQRHRGDIFEYRGTTYAVVGFDGRHEGYVCWPLERSRLGASGRSTHDDDSVWNTQQTTLVAREKAHHDAVTLHPATLPALPALPALDHTGRLESQQMKKSRVSRGSPQESPVMLEQERAIVAVGDSTAVSSTALAYPPLSTYYGSGVRSPRTPEPEYDTPEATPELQPVGSRTPEEPVDPHDEQETRHCVCGVLKALGPTLRAATSTLFFIFQSWLLRVEMKDTRVRSGSQRPSTTGSSPQSPCRTLSIMDAGSGSACKTLALTPRRMDVPSAPHALMDAERQKNDALADMNVTIPILKPPGWQEVQALAHRMPVTFDERGTKEMMTVKPRRWDDFVDKQKAKLLKEIDELLAERAELAGQDQQMSESSKERAECAEDSDDDCSDSSGAEDDPLETDELRTLDEDIAELQRIADSMDDWKDLAKYSGRTISMASTQRGNEMKIHVMAFAEREDGRGVDFVRLSYKKSVSVRRDLSLPGVPVALRSLLPACIPGSSAKEERWIQLLQQPDIAKFTIALVFRSALANEGIHLQFCDSNLDALGN
eukprot:TRINITY_DN17850_c0_g2_i2.p1 TRINITY_DN17850_c0_g2~~TRINITY_DN17850_c0_g2_i2.p1  ORF type:complete len:611 (-),score=121.95 TRINITY_DN17850_c0_g2_i2:172-1950(-)